ncbi:3-isopropylmalate dehydratase large subunit [Oribacterium sp. oral taxon 102]|uniref:3-isopropylmalate dehydratase large subunit n=1 Tax=Oribacterium sp. oral taxon 102 TaxID=671214 RepID=UPI0015BA6121|nr:3-isopropylmalate dehydratase large subunit [Oribacterium sp. oral taxon 102]NWO21402.1 3-isopropylmalate dehydratase large subunit [Oribacterium sp. oral taxon 102]
MGMTMSQKILAKHAGLCEVTAGQLIEARLDLVHGNDITTPVAIREMKKLGRKEVFDREKVVFVMDHFVPNKDITSAKCTQLCRNFAREQGLTNYFDVGRMGIEHALIPEQGLIVAGELSVGADSHTCTYGALGAFSTGVGSTDMAAAMATGRLWFKVPGAIRVNLVGRFRPWVSGKDLILHLIGEIGVDGARYQSLEFTGPGIAALSMDDRFTVCNMAIEAGAKNGIFPVDQKTITYIEAHSKKPYESFIADADAVYERELTIDLSALRPTVSFPHLPENTHIVGEFGEIPIDQAVIGSCTNGRLQDMEEAARVLAGRRIAENVRCIIIPATQEIYITALKRGWIQSFVEAGAVVSTPTCGPCLGGYMGILAPGERCISTTNRNFVGRMGDASSEVYLASPAVAAASAVTGRISEPAELGL